jgi:hypothetical protein
MQIKRLEIIALLLALVAVLAELGQLSIDIY